MGSSSSSTAPGVKRWVPRSPHELLVPDQPSARTSLNPPAKEGKCMSQQQYRMAVGSDDAGVHLKDYIRDRLKEDPRVVEVRDFGVADASDTTPYPIICIKVAEAVARGE